MNPIDAIIALLPAGDTAKAGDIHAAAKRLSYTWSQYGKIIMAENRRRERGYYFIGDLRDSSVAPPPKPSATFTAPEIQAPLKPKAVFRLETAEASEIHIPAKDPHYIPWGNYELVEKIIAARRFFPVFLSGVSGNGKTLMIEQACARSRREMVRVQISPETDEDSLIGGMRLVGGETVFAHGPIINAMKKGAVCLIDEIDRSSSKLMCLQGILEGKPVLIPRTGEIVYPHPEFTIIATANTKGRGSSDGKYVFATMMDDAFLERFNINIEQEFPTMAIEKRIISSHMEKYGVKDEGFVETLANWSETIRKTYEAGGMDDIISTRRLGLIVNTYAIVQDRLESIRLCVNRFDKEVSEAFLDLYTKIDATVSRTK